MKKDKKDLTPSETLKNNPFAALSSLREKLPEGRAAPQETPKAAPTPKRAVLRLERKGHGGKEMTRIEKLGLSSEALAAWLKDLKQTLGCGGVVEGEDILLQGDQRERLVPLLTTKGIKTSN
jgi:translation initiation factor 1